MMLAASNIAWPSGGDAQAFACLRAAGFTGIEVAPTKIWPGWEGAGTEGARALAARYRSEGFAIPALQSILFGTEGAALFGDYKARSALRSAVLRAADLAGELGAPVMVFGSPGMRRLGAVDYPTALRDVASFLSEVAGQCRRRGTVLCIEPNPPAYGCNFITDAMQGDELACMAPGLGLHLDAAGIELSGSSAAATASLLAGRFLHFHASQPHLGPFGDGGTRHAATGEALRRTAYTGWVSLEMREQPEPWDALEHALAAVASAYGDGADTDEETRT